MREISTADAKNDSELRTNAVSRPNAADTIPPSDAPIATIADKVLVDTALAETSSRRSTTSGTVDDRAGSKKPVVPTVTAVTRYASHTIDGVRTKSNPSTVTPL